MTLDSIRDSCNVFMLSLTSQIARIEVVPAEIRNSAAEGKFDHFGPLFFAKSPCLDGFRELLFLALIFTFLGVREVFFRRLKHFARIEVVASTDAYRGSPLDRPQSLFDSYLKKISQPSWIG